MDGWELARTTRHPWIWFEYDGYGKEAVVDGEPSRDHSGGGSANSRWSHKCRNSHRPPL